jgi:hypothetical protein
MRNPLTENGMARYKQIDTSPRFIAVDLERQLLPGSFDDVLDYLSEHEIDLSGFDGRYRNDATGAAAYPPGLLLKVVLFAYSHQIIVAAQSHGTRSEHELLLPMDTRQISNLSGRILLSVRRRPDFPGQVKPEIPTKSAGTVLGGGKCRQTECCIALPDERIYRQSQCTRIFRLPAVPVSVAKYSRRPESVAQTATDRY